MRNEFYLSVFIICAVQSEAVNHDVNQMEYFIYNAVCSIKTEADLEILKPFLHNDSSSNVGKFYSSVPAKSNTIKADFVAPENVQLTKGNGFCSKGVYKSWQPCNDVGNCYSTCTDGLCYDEYAAKAEELKPLPSRGCLNYQLQCARECAEDDNCVAFSFTKIEQASYHPRFECQLMTGTICTQSEIDQSDPRQTYHVKGSFVEGLFARFGITTVTELDVVLETENEFVYGHWSSWSECRAQEWGEPLCGIGKQVRGRKMNSDKKEDGWERRPCQFANIDGSPIACVAEEKQIPTLPHGWMSWGEWSPCTKTCVNRFKPDHVDSIVGQQMRVRSCGTCDNPDSSNYCGNPTRSIRISDDTVSYCNKETDKLTRECADHDCLPHSNHQWYDPETDRRHYYRVEGWRSHPSNNHKSEVQNIGGCTNFEADSFMQLSLNTTDEKLNDNYSLKNQAAFGECMRICSTVYKERCLSVTYFPSYPPWKQFFGTPNCFLHEIRCHEQDTFRSKETVLQVRLKSGGQNTHKDRSISWYSYKDSCNVRRICSRLQNYFQATCNSSGENAFPSQPKCSCTAGQDSHSGYRLFGNALGIRFYDTETGRYRLRTTNTKLTQKASWYSEKRYERMFKSTSVKSYEHKYKNNNMACHDPCAHNKCGKNSQCEFDASAEFGYNCVCKYPFTLNPNNPSAYNNDDGCMATDHRNLDDSFADGEIIFGGGWHYNRPPGSKKSEESNPSDRYYGLRATSDPYRYKVLQLSERMPGNSCLMHIEENEVMVTGGKNGDSYNDFDDKTFVYRYLNNPSNGEWIGTDNLKMSSSPSSCVGESGCMREHDWPDLPATSVFKCEGQCRNATAGHGPTDPSWIHEYCLIDGNFYNPGTQSFNKKSFNICEYELKSDHAGVKVQGLPGKWSSERRSSSEFKEMWDEYALALAQTAKIYRGQLARNEFHLNETTLSKTINGQLHNTTVNYAMKQLLDPSVFNPVAGPQTSFTDRAQGVRFSFIKNNVKKFRRNNAQGQPVCGILGDRAYIGSGTIGQLFSLSRNKHNAATEKVWRLEPKSTFPEPYRTTDGRRCLGRTHAGGSHFDLYPNFRQSVGIMSTTEGLWMLGGLLQPAADIPNRDFYERYGDVEGCSIASQFRDVWVFNPRGWNRSVVLGDAAEHYNEVTPDSAILPKRYAYEILKDVEQRMDQSFSDFRLSDTPGPNGLTIESAIDLGWECTGVQGNWCRKPSLPRHVKGPETVILCFEYVEGFETYQEEIIGPTGNIEWGPTQQVPKRPRACTMSETANPTSNCICYLVNISGQSGYKNQPNRTAFRTEVDYLEVRRADGTFGSDRPFYSEVTDEWCSNANKVYETDPDIVVTDESTVDNFSECRKCNGSECNRHWKKRNLRRKWHEAGRIRYPRVGFMAATLKGEALLWGGECGGIEEGVKPTNLQFDGGCRSCFATHNCRMQIYNTPTGPVSKNGDYMEKFVIFRMNRSGYLFGARRHVELDGYFPGGVSHDESAVSQHFSKLNTNIKYYA